MKKISVNIDPQKPVIQWVANYMNANRPLFSLIKIIKKTRRKEALEIIFKNPKFSYAKDLINANSKGEIVFTWADPQEMTFFLAKWC